MENVKYFTQNFFTASESRNIFYVIFYVVTSTDVVGEVAGVMPYIRNAAEGAKSMTSYIIELLALKLCESFLSTGE